MTCQRKLETESRKLYFHGMGSVETGTTEKTEVKRKKKRKGKIGLSDGSKSTQFKPGNQAAKKGAIPRVEADFDMLAAMRHVLVNPESTDKTAGEKAIREWLKKAPAAFMQEKQRLETESGPADKPAETDAEDAVEETEDDEEVRLQIEELLKKHQMEAKT